MKSFLTDRTNWQRMLKNEISTDDLLERKQTIAAELDADFRQYVTDDQDICELTYPVDTFPTKVKSMSFDKLPEIEGELSGIKGQYLIFSDGRVINIRKHAGYFIEFSAR